jgi:MFS superfamily sulfate permease-like transporter
MFYRVGGNTRLSGYMLAFVTLLVLLAGPWVISYLPVMVVGALICEALTLAPFGHSHSDQSFWVWTC